MRRQLWALFFLLAPVGAAAAEVPLAEQQSAYRTITSLAEGGALDAEMQRRISYQLCSELSGCAGPCKSAFELSAKPDTDDNQRTALVANCAPDYRQRREHGERLHPDAWLHAHLIEFLGSVGSRLGGHEQRKFAAARATLKLLK